MKKIITIITCAFLSTTIMAQSKDWSKDDRTKVYNDGINLLKNYNSINDEQKEIITMCYLDQVTKSSSKTTYMNMIDAEVKKYAMPILQQCAKNIGITLSSLPTNTSASNSSNQTTTNVVNSQPTIKSSISTANSFLKGNKSYVNLGISLTGMDAWTIPLIYSFVDRFDFNVNNLCLNFGFINGLYFKSQTVGGQTYTATRTSFSFAPGISYYLNDVLNLDKEKYHVYGGANLVLNYFSTSVTGSTGTHKLSFDVAARLGGRYMFSKSLGVFADIFAGKGDPMFCTGIVFQKKK